MIHHKLLSLLALASLYAPLSWAMEPGFVFSRNDTEEFRWIDTNGSGELGSIWIDQACAERLGGVAETGNWFDLIALAPGFDTIANPCSAALPSSLDSVATGLDSVFDTINGKALESMLVAYSRLSARSGFMFIESINDPELDASVDLYACPDGGAASAVSTTVTGVGPRSIYVAENCRIANLNFSGRFVQRAEFGQEVFSQRNSESIGVTDFFFSDSDQGLTVSMDEGVLNRNTTGSPGTVVSQFVSASNLMVDGPADSYQASTVTVSISDPDFPLDFDNIPTGVSVNISGLNSQKLNDTVNVSSVTQLTLQSESNNPAGGLISIRGDRTNWLIDTDGGNPDTFVVIVDDADVSAAFVENWRAPYSFQFLPN